MTRISKQMVRQAKAERIARQAKAEKRREQITQLVRDPSRHSEREPAERRGMTRLWGHTGEVMYGDGQNLLYVTSSYDDGAHYWLLEDADLAKEAEGLRSDVNGKPGRRQLFR